MNGLKLPCHAFRDPVALPSILRELALFSHGIQL